MSTPSVKPSSDWRIINADVLDGLAQLPEASVQCVVTSPPYWGLRDYGEAGQFGLEAAMDCLGWATGTPCGECYVCHIVGVFSGIRRILKDDGVVFLNLGDSYAGSHVVTHNSIVPMGTKAKDLCMIPARVALALQASGWWVRSDITWDKINGMPESVTDRPTKSHEYIFMLAKSQTYFYDVDAVRNSYEGRPMNRWGGKKLVANGTSAWDGGTGQQYYRDRDMRPNPAGANLRDVWQLPTGQFDMQMCTACQRIYTGAQFKKLVKVAEFGKNHNKRICHCGRYDAWLSHFATFPEALPERCIQLASRVGDTILDPFAGAGTTLLVASRLGRSAIGIELNPAYIKLTEARIAEEVGVTATQATVLDMGKPVQLKMDEV